MLIPTLLSAFAAASPPAFPEVKVTEGRAHVFDGSYLSPTVVGPDGRLFGIVHWAQGQEPPYPVAVQPSGDVAIGLPDPHWAEGSYMGFLPGAETPYVQTFFGTAFRMDSDLRYDGVSFLLPKPRLNAPYESQFGHLPDGRMTVMYIYPGDVPGFDAFVLNAAGRPLLTVRDASTQVHGFYFYPDGSLLILSGDGAAGITALGIDRTGHRTTASLGSHQDCEVAGLTAAGLTAVSCDQQSNFYFLGRDLTVAHSFTGTANGRLYLSRTDSRILHVAAGALDVVDATGVITARKVLPGLRAAAFFGDAGYTYTAAASGGAVDLVFLDASLNEVASWPLSGQGPTIYDPQFSSPVVTVYGMGPNGEDAALVAPGNGIVYATNNATAIGSQSLLPVANGAIALETSCFEGNGVPTCRYASLKMLTITTSVTAAPGPADARDPASR